LGRFERQREPAAAQRKRGEKRVEADPVVRGGNGKRLKQESSLDLRVGGLLAAIGGV
jgi:hypothetical protein